MEENIPGIHKIKYSVDIIRAQQQKQVYSSKRITNVILLENNTKYMPPFNQQPTTPNIETDEPSYSEIVSNPSAFKNLSDEELANNFLLAYEDGEDGSSISLEGLNPETVEVIVDKLIKNGRAYSVITEIQKFKGVDQNGVLRKIASNYREWQEALDENLYLFSGLTMDTANFLIEETYPELVKANINSFVEGDRGAILSKCEDEIHRTN